jgi:hypothetical protein
MILIKSEINNYNTDRYKNIAVVRSFIEITILTANYSLLLGV